MIKKWAEKVKILLKKIPFHPLFLLLFIWFILSNKLIEFIAFFLCLILHELGHFFVSKKLGYKLNKFYLSIYGAKLDYFDTIFSERDEVLIALAGPLTNLVFCIIISSLWWFYPITFNFTRVLFEQSLMLGLINLLPCYKMDGGRVLSAIISTKISKVKALKITKILCYIFAGIFLLLFIISCFINYNPTFVLFVIFLLSAASETEEDIKYNLVSFYKKESKNFSKVKVLYLSGDCKLIDALKKIENNKTTIFYLDFLDHQKLIDDKKIINLSLVYNQNLTFKEIFYNQK